MSDSAKDESRIYGNLIVEAHSNMQAGLQKAQADLFHKLEESVEKDEMFKGLLGSERLGIFASSGKGVDLWPFHWIVVIYADGEGGKSCYNVALSQQRLDTNTGNPHSVFGKIQFWRNLQGDTEKGGNPNGSCTGEIVDDPCSPDNGERFWNLQYFADKAYPRALTRGCGGSQGRPWGLQGFEWPQVVDGKPREPELDIASPDYDPSYVAECFVALMKADLDAKGLINAQE